MEFNLYEFSIHLLGDLPPQLSFLYGIFTFIIAISVLVMFFSLFTLTLSFFRRF